MRHGPSVGFEGDFGVAVRVFEVEVKDFDAQISFLAADLHSHVELGSNVKVVGAGVAPERHRQHVPHHHQFVLTPPPLHNAFVVEVLWEIFD